jgi:class 3 adenylate cyclase/tetratricopeptide (TPR) repeat protein
MPSVHEPVPHEEALAPERRQVTVLFCDLVDSTHVAEAVDPEELRSLYLAYRVLCDTAISEFGGHVLEYQGDGILASFGYPVVVESTAQRAIRAAIRLVDAVAGADWTAFTTQPIRVRVGIHSGIVIAADLAARPQQGDFTGIVGATLNIASRLQGLAQPNSVVISEDARVLVEHQFPTVDLGEHYLKGLSRPVRAHLVAGAAAAPIELCDGQRSELPPLVGRAQELSVMMKYWTHVRSGRGATLLVTGDPGIGKSRLVAEFSAVARAQPGVRLLEFQCSPYYRHSALFPVIETLEREVGKLTSSTDRLASLERLVHGVPSPEEAIPLLGLLLSIPMDGHYTLPALSPEAARKRTIDHVVEWALLRAEEEPVLILVNDIHWIDPTTLNLIHQIIERVSARKAMAVLSFRPEIDAESIRSLAGDHSIALRPLLPTDMEQLVYHAAGDRHLPKEIVRNILDSTGGIPLFGEELTKAVIRSDLVVDRGGRFQLSHWRSELDVPPTLQDILHVRLDRMGPARRVAQLASILGRKFTRRLLSELWADEKLDEHIEVLMSEGLLDPAGDGSDRFVFRHALIHKAAYESLLKSTRRLYHQRVARFLATQSDRSHEDPPELVAQHFSLGGLYELAVPLWLEAAGRSLRRSANLEASAQADEGLGCIRELNFPAQLKEAELLLLSIKGTALIAARGWSVEEVRDSFARAAEINQTVSGMQHTPALWGLWVYRFMRGELDVARQHAEQLLRMGEESGNTSILIEGHWTLGATLYWQHDVEGSRDHLQTAVRLYDPSAHRQNAFIYGQDPGVSARAWLTFALTFCGRFKDAMRCGREALELAREVDHPFSTAWALAANTILHVELNDVEGALALGEEALRYCMEQEQAFWVAALLMAVGWAKTRAGNAEEGIAMAEQGFAAYEATGARLILSFFAALLSDCHLASGNLSAAEEWMERGFAIAEAQKEVPIFPTLLLIKGLVLLKKGPQHAADAQVAFRDALARSIDQGARMRELQAATALAQLFVVGGEVNAAKDLLAPVVKVFLDMDESSVAQPAIMLLESLDRPQLG